MSEMKLKRPTREMMLAVNASIDGSKKEMEELVKTHKLDPKELETRLELREGKKYPMTRKSRGGRPAKDKGKATPTDLVSMIDGRTKIVTLLRLEEKVQQLLGEKDKAEVSKVRSAIKSVDKLRKDLKEAESLLA